MSKRKLVLEEHEGSVLAGITQEGCDPVLKTIAGTLEDALAEVPQLLTEAQEKWAGAPRNPAYTPPKAAKRPAAATPAAPAQTAEELPLLAGQAATEPTTEPATEPATEAETEAETGNEPETEPATEPTTEPTAETSDTANETAEVAALAAQATEPPPAAPRAAATGTNGWEYRLKDGRGPYADIQAAMDELGLDKATRPQHQRWDRLSTQLKAQIERRAKS